MKKIILLTSLILTNFVFFGGVITNATTENWIETETINIQIEIDFSEMSAEQAYNLFNFLYDNNFIFDNGEYQVDWINDFEIIKDIYYVPEMPGIMTEITISFNIENVIIYHYLNVQYDFFKTYNSWLILNGTIEIPKEIYNNVWINGYGMGYGDGENVGYGQGYSAGHNDGYDYGYDLGYNTGYDLGYAAGEIDGFNNGYDLGYAAGVLAGENKAYSDGYFEGRNDGIDIGYDLGYGDGKNDGIDIGYVDGESFGYDNGYNDGYYYGYDNGYDLGYNDGYQTAINDGESEFGITTLLSGLFVGLGSLLSIELLPNISIGMIIAVPIVFGIIAFILGKRGGGD